MEDVAALVACGYAKRSGKNVAWAVYDSTLFEKSWAAASMIGQPFVMSAKHELLTVDDRVEKYNKTLNDFSKDERTRWAKNLDEQLPNHYNTVVVFGGRNYVNPIKRVFDRNIIDPYENCSGNGQQMAVAGEIIKSELNGESYL